MAYAKTHKDCVFLVDTYDTLKSGVPSAIRVAKELGDKINFQGVRIDSGDMAYISKRVREQLDAAGFTEAKIYASNDLDEATILNLKMQKAKIDVWGVGTKLITAYDQPALGAVFKLVSIEDSEGNMVDTIKLSSNAEKVTTPGKNKYGVLLETLMGNLKEIMSHYGMKILEKKKLSLCFIQCIRLSIKLFGILPLVPFYKISLSKEKEYTNYPC